MPFELLDHTADIGLLIRGTTLEELFLSAGRGLQQVIGGDPPVGKGDIAEEVSLAGDRLDDLLVRWLQEWLYLFDSQGLVVVAVDGLTVEPTRVRARLHCRRIDPHRVRAEREVKAVTYHRLRLEQTAHGWEAEIYLDL